MLADRIREVAEAGLPLQVAGSLLRIYCSSAAQYPLRLEVATDEQIASYDNTVGVLWGDLVGRTMDEEMA
eukprot:9181253-Prorocentrum_lima.AAC.1